MPDLHETILRRVQQFSDRGAVPIEGAFSVAGGEQQDLSLDNRWLFVTPNDDLYKRYTTLNEKAGLPYIHNDSGLGDEEVVVGVIVNDARSLPQIMRPRQSPIGLNSQDVFHMLGHALGELVKADTEAETLPINLDLERILVLRLQQEVMFTPTTDIEPGTDKDLIVRNMRQQLLPRYARYGGEALLHAFTEGLGQ